MYAFTLVLYSLVICNGIGHVKGNISSNIDRKEKKFAENKRVKRNVAETPTFSDNVVCNDRIHIVKTTELNENYAMVGFNYIAVSDNIEQATNVTCLMNDSQPCHYEMGKQYKIKITEGLDIDFKVTNRAGDAVYYKFKIIVKDAQPPVMISCPNNIKIETSSRFEKVFWKEPQYDDNCGNNQTSANCLTISKIYNSGSNFFVNTKTAVAYKATDSSGNQNNQCIFFVEVTRKAVVPPGLNVPINGVLVWTDFFARMYCRSGGYYPDGEVSFFYLFFINSWRNLLTNQVVSKLPDCIKKSPPTGNQGGLVQGLIFRGQCDDPAVKTQLTHEVAALSGVPPTEVQYSCGSSAL